MTSGLVIRLKEIVRPSTRPARTEPKVARPSQAPLRRKIQANAPETLVTRISATVRVTTSSIVIGRSAGGWAYGLVAGPRAPPRPPGCTGDWARIGG